MEQQQLLIPMAGLGTRFRDAGWTTRKPFIEVDGVPMVRRVLQTMQLPEEQLTVVCLHDDVTATRQVFPTAHAVVPIDYQPDGTTYSVLKAVPALDADRPVLVANADQIVRWDLRAFLARMDEHDAAAGVLTFDTATGNKWSYVVADPDGTVHKVVAKRPVSTLGVVGVYWYRTARGMERAMQRMIAANDRTKGEFYVCPSLNYVDDGPVVAFPCEEMHGTGTPEDLARYSRPRLV